jgi:hypothetical protein
MCTSIVEIARAEAWQSAEANGSRYRKRGCL